eukprot:TRINITY_DN290_c0_g1_i1.p1 TRINITY_DN290_c0_g1~~TRINITY_DN290_c0_g1_i1.p1  ORF type:complete len:135 (+),score=28.44 TRINITY_DN290_c0_g1_i1:32-406(+)
MVEKIRASQLRDKKKGDLQKLLEENRKELAQLRVAKVTGANPAKIMRIREVRKSIGRILTVMNQAQKAALRKFYGNKKYKPLDLRRKATRAIRRRLTPKQQNAKTHKQIMKERRYPMRVFAVKI